MKTKLFCIGLLFSCLSYSQQESAVIVPFLNAHFGEQKIAAAKEFADATKYSIETINQVKGVLGSLNDIKNKIEETNRKLNNEYIYMKSLYQDVKNLGVNDILYSAQEVLGVSLNPNNYVPKLGGALWGDLNVPAFDFSDDIQYEPYTKSALVYTFVKDVSAQFRDYTIKNLYAYYVGVDKDFTFIKTREFSIENIKVQLGFEYSALQFMEKTSVINSAKENLLKMQQMIKDTLTNKMSANDRINIASSLKRSNEKLLEATIQENIENENNKQKIKKKVKYAAIRMNVKKYRKSDSKECSVHNNTEAQSIRYYLTRKSYISQ